MGEQGDLSRAVLLSKQERFSNDDVSIFRLTKHSPKVFEVLLESPELSGCCQRVADAGCHARPPWTRGLILIPLTEEQYKELDLQLEPHHVLAQACDREPLEHALRRVPCRIRPQVRTDHRALACAHIGTNIFPAVSLGADLAMEEATPASNSAEDGPCLQIVRTFLHSPATPLVTEASSSKLAHSAPPCTDDVVGHQRIRISGVDSKVSCTPNPRRWK